jgi:hypothetical protein
MEIFFGEEKLKQGNTSILIASECLSNVNHGKGLLLGGIARIVIASSY